jgi:chromosome partitioning protein
LSGRPQPAGFSAGPQLTATPPSLPAAPFVLVPSDRALLGLERQPEQHTPMARRLRAFLAAADGAFDLCVIDTNPNPDIRVIAALASADWVLSPIQLNQEAMDGVSGLLNHDRVGLRKVKAVLNPKLALVGLLPTMVEATPYQRANFIQVVQAWHALLIRTGAAPGAFASIPRRACIAEAQSEGTPLWALKKSAAREAWREIEPSLARIVEIVTGQGQPVAHVASDAAAAR